MGESSLATIKARPKLSGATQQSNNKKCMRPEVLGKRFTWDTAKHNITIIAHKLRGTLILKQFVENPTTPLKGGTTNT